MKILMTGYTTRMWGSQRIHGDYITFSTLLKKILWDMGHEVDQRVVAIGEEISYVYDYAFCGLAPLSSMTSAKVPETHYVMDSMSSRHCVYADDWSFCSYGDSVRYSLKKWNGYIKYKNFPYNPLVLNSTKESLERMMSIQLEANNAPVLCPMFRWGNHDLLIENNYKANLITLDPSAYLSYPTMQTYGYNLKKRQWVMAALSDHSGWINRQDFKLPIFYIGNKRKNGGLVIPERETLNVFAQNYGVLSVGYPSAGCGWWRTRYLNAAWAETLIYSDPIDADMMDPAFIGNANFFESLSESQYNKKLMAQSTWLKQNIMSKDEIKDVIRKLIEK